MTNPFQLAAEMPGNPQINRRERFKKVFFAVLAAHVILFLTLLIQARGQDATSLPSGGSVLAQVQN